MTLSLKDRDIIVMSSDWNRFPGSVQHVVEVLAKVNRVLWVSGIPIRPPRLRWGDLRRILDKGRKMLATSVNADAPKLPVREVHPLFIPYYDVPWIRGLNDRLLRNLLAGMIRDLGFSDFIVLASNPMTAGVVGTLGETSAHYLCIDDYAANKGTFRCLGELELNMLRKVDSSWSMSDVLLKSRIPRSGENHFFPEGVDIDHFRLTEGPVPDALRDIKKPIVGYCGLLAWWVDLDLIARSARAYPDVSFVIIGEAKTDVSILKREPNVFLLGHIPYAVLPRYMESFHVGLIPRHINRLTVAMNPLKLLEYLAMGMSVVSSNLPEVRKFGHGVFVARDKEQFVKFVGEALSDTSAEGREMRTAIARRFSWHSVAEELGKVIQQVEAKKRATGSRTPLPLQPGR